MNPADQLRLAHIAGLAAIAGWLSWAHPGGWLPATLVALIAAAGEVLPRGVWRELGSPALTLAAAVIAWALGDGSRATVHALLGTLVTALVLIPARPGVLRLVAPLAVMELVVLGLPGSSGPPPWIAAVVLAPLACLALATDAWLEARLGARRTGLHHSHLPGRAWLAWALLPALAAGSLGALAFAPAQSLAHALRPAPVRTDGKGGEAAPRTSTGIKPSERIGIDPGGPPPRDPSPAARLFLPTDPDQLVYLRLAACSRLQRDAESGRLRWLPAPGEVELDDTPPPAGATIADLVSLGGVGDSVLAPDNGGWVGLSDMWADGDGNRWRPELGSAIRSYRVSLDGPPRFEPEADRALAAAICRELPPAIAEWPWSTIEDARWAGLPAEQAARAIIARLHERCAYDLDTPQAVSEPLATFMFGNDRDRRGTCEHFAGASTLLLRRAGHPARCVAGYASSEWDGSGITFRKLHAHAWAEILLPNGRWQRIDATPAAAHTMISRLDHGDQPPPQLTQAVPLHDRPRSGLPAFLIAGVLAAIGLVAIGRHLVQRRRLRRRDLQAVHRRRGIELVELARRLGVRVSPADSAASICAAITTRTGLGLSRELAAYERARFGGGPPPPPWPTPGPTPGPPGPADE